MFKRFCLVAIFALLFAGLVFGFAPEGTKTMRGDKPVVTITVPEKAPDFLRWQSMLLGGEQYEDGNVLLLVQFISPDERTVVNALWAKIGEKYSVLAFAVFYLERAGDPPDLYEDLTFLKTGNPSGILVRVEIADPITMFRIHLIPKRGV